VELPRSLSVSRMQCARPMFFNATAEVWFDLRASPAASALKNLSGASATSSDQKAGVACEMTRMMCLSKFESMQDGASLVAISR